MNCADSERLIALDVEGDLPKHQAGGVSQHLRNCPHCREFAEKLRASQTFLKELAHEAPDAVLLQEVRVGVLNRLSTEAAPSIFPVWRFAFGAAVVAMLAFAAIMWRRPAPAPPGPVTAMVQPSAATQAMRKVTASAPTSPARNPERARAAATGKSFAGSLPALARRRPEPLMVKLYTDNPNVVIYWQVD